MTVSFIIILTVEDRSKSTVHFESDVNAIHCSSVRRRKINVELTGNRTRTIRTKGVSIEETSKENNIYSRLCKHTRAL